MDPRMMTAPFESRLEMDGPDYFSAMGIGPFGSRAHGGPFPPGFDPETMMGMGGAQHYVDDVVRR